MLGGLFGGGGGGGGGGLSGLFGNLGVGFNMSDIPVAGNLFADPREQFAQEQMQRGLENVSAYRPEAAQARMNAMRQATSVLAPVNNMLGAMYGPGAQMDLTQVYQNPMGPGMFTAGQPYSAQAPPRQGGGQGGGGLF